MLMSNKHHFVIGGHHVCIVFTQGQMNSMELLPSFAPFAIGDDDHNGEEPFITLTVNDEHRPTKDRILIRKFDTGNGDTIVYKLLNGGYEYIIRDTLNRDCCLLSADKNFRHCQCALNGNWNMRSFGLNDALMLIYAFAGSYQKTMLIHASCVRYDNKAYPFIAQSGTGKSTHSSLWLKHIEGTDLINDDNPIVRIDTEGAVWLYGSPWSGKTPCYRNVKVRLGAITRIERAPQNSIERLGPVKAFASMLPACSSMKWDSDIYRRLGDAITHIIETTPIYTLYCLPDEEAARLCQKTIHQ